MLYESSSSAPGYETLYEEVITVVQAESKNHAEARAREIGVSRHTEYVNQFGEQIVWSLKLVLDTVELNEGLADGAEIYFRHFHDYDAYCRVEPLLSRGGEGGSDVVGPHGQGGN